MEDEKYIERVECRERIDCIEGEGIERTELLRCMSIECIECTEDIDCLASI